VLKPRTRTVGFTLGGIWVVLTIIALLIADDRGTISLIAAMSAVNLVTVAGAWSLSSTATKRVARSLKTKQRRWNRQLREDIRRLQANLASLEGSSKEPPSICTEPGNPSIRTEPGRRITRAEAGVHDTPRSPAEFAAKPTVEWIHDPASSTPSVAQNPFASRTREELLEWLTGEAKWRHHHHIKELIESGNLYDAYVRRVDAMLAMCDTALDRASLGDLANVSAVDLASSEGFVAHHLLSRGLNNVDCFELSLGGIQRQLAVEALHGLTGTRTGRMDLEAVNWAAALPRYDLVVALGIIYHVENPMMFARNILEITGRAAIIESDTPNYPHNHRFRSNGVVYLNREQVTLERGNIRYLTEMRPDRVALAQMFLSAGFSSVEFIEPDPNADYFASGAKSVMLCRKDA
jgi:hypothetical protein